MKEMPKLDLVSRLLVVIGALNWGLVAFLNKDLVASIFGAGTLATLVYALVALAGLYELVNLFK